jgi:hypothetical protein
MRSLKTLLVGSLLAALFVAPGLGTGPAEGKQWKRSLQLTHFFDAGVGSLRRKISPADVSIIDPEQLAR